ncbi:MAG TPA: GNAT family protein [Mycobacteriales bacterium]|nr:GNAT family protein [Mycobacteriales bacterium]
MAELLPRDLGDGVVLHAACAADAAEAFEIVSAERARLREWLPWIDDTTDVETQARFLTGLEQAAYDGRGIYVAIRLDNSLVGFADVRRDRLGAGGEVGYWLAAAAEGRGVMTRTVAALIDVSFDTLRLHRVQLQAGTANLRSRAVAERLGMTFEGVRREAEQLPDRFVDLAVYSVLAHEWPGSVTALAGG